MDFRYLATRNSIYRWNVIGHFVFICDNPALERSGDGVCLRGVAQ